MTGPVEDWPAWKRAVVMVGSFAVLAGLPWLNIALGLWDW